MRSIAPLCADTFDGTISERAQTAVEIPLIINKGSIDIKQAINWVMITQTWTTSIYSVFALFASPAP